MDPSVGSSGCYHGAIRMIGGDESRTLCSRCCKCDSKTIRWRTGYLQGLRELPLVRSDKIIKLQLLLLFAVQRSRSIKVMRYAELER
ncbi:unnamed protein product [Lasius platythorax]|uniref:Uncharacterized protein n=1 Tax=Lasius platythorax TaxID=488582 RepID=A0AAV2NWN7_9HYME